MSKPAPAPALERRKSRRVTVVVMSHLLRGAVNRAADATVRAAPADVDGHRVVDVVVGGTWVRGQESGGRHDLPRLTVAALGHVFLDPRLLQPVPVLRGQAFDGGHLVAGSGGDGRHARAHRLAVQMDGAGAALAHAAPELGAR